MKIKWIILFFALVVPVQVLAQDDSTQTNDGQTSDANLEQALTKIDTVSLENERLKKQVEELVKRFDGIDQKNEDEELEKLIAEANAESKVENTEEELEERNFNWGALSLQKLNPEISISADILATLIVDEDKNFYSPNGDRSGFSVREISLHMQHMLDPFSSFKAAIAFIPGPNPEVEVEEIYITWFGVIPSMSFSIGRFRQNFGVVNRWHAHDLDQTSYPLALTSVLGDDGLNQTGIMMKWFLPQLWADANELTLEVTNAENSTLLAGEFFSIPSAVAHLKNYWDLSDDTYLEFGLSGLWGMNNKRGYLSVDDNTTQNEPWRQTIVGGADFTLQWTPVQKAKYRSFTWRSEGYLAARQMSTDPAMLQIGEADVDGKRNSFGVYSYLDFQVNERIFLGVRGDIALPTKRVEHQYAWDVVPYLTFWQSEFVYFRLEYRHEANVPYVNTQDEIALRTDDIVMLQIDFAAGPHKHEKY